MFYMLARDIAIGRMDAMSFSSISLKKKFMEERFNLTLNVSDPFNLSGFSFYTEGENWEQEASQNWSSRTVHLTLLTIFKKV